MRTTIHDLVRAAHGYVLGYRWRLGALLMGALWGFSAWAQPCKVLDPELNARYVGGCRNGLANGKGQAYGTSTYVGGFKEGMKDGYGVKIWPWGDRYEGEFKNDRRNGKGTYTWGTGTRWAGERYEGEYKNDLRHGWGVYQWPNGDRYEGRWQNDQRMGYSVMETRRIEAAAALAKAMGVPGTTVCTRWTSGIGNVEQMKGTVRGVKGIRIEVQIAEVGKDVSGYKGLALHEGMVIADDIYGWRPCN